MLAEVLREDANQLDARATSLRRLAEGIIGGDAGYVVHLVASMQTTVARLRDTADRIDESAFRHNQRLRHQSQSGLG
jgi:hypothetical protein